jgi:hypothetical protein
MLRIDVGKHHQLENIGIFQPLQQTHGTDFTGLFRQQQIAAGRENAARQQQRGRTPAGGDYGRSAVCAAIAPSLATARLNPTNGASAMRTRTRRSSCSRR